MEFVDTHSHLYLPEFDTDRDQTMERAVLNGVKRIFLPNIDSSTVGMMNKMAKEYPGVCYPMMGLHPTSVKENYKSEIDAVVEELKEHHYAAIGEIGIDLYWDKTYYKHQCEAFTTQLDLSLFYHLPVVIHARESFKEIMELLQPYKGKGLFGIFHAFSGTREIAQEVIDKGFKLGIGGVITYKKSDLPEIIRQFSLEHFVLETDSPYLTPVPFRGKRNESSYIPYIAETIASIKNVSLNEVARITTNNAMELFLPDNNG